LKAVSAILRSCKLFMLGLWRPTPLKSNGCGFCLSCPQLPAHVLTGSEIGNQKRLNTSQGRMLSGGCSAVVTGTSNRKDRPPSKAKKGRAFLYKGQIQMRALENKALDLGYIPPLHACTRDPPMMKLRYAMVTRRYLFHESHRRSPHSKRL
jgi:hypothetical protein